MPSLQSLAGFAVLPKMVCIRQATVEDLLQMQRCNLLCLPENYQLKVGAARSSSKRLPMLWPHAEPLPSLHRGAPLAL